MSTQAVADFAAAAQRDPAVAQGLARALEGRTGEEALAALAAEARARGYDVAVDDLAAVRERVAAKNGDEALADDDLDGVAGGGKVFGDSFIGKGLDWITDFVFGPEGSR